MKFMKLFAASLAILSALVASQAVQAHATYNAGGTGASPNWANGAPAEWIAPTATVPSSGYYGIHGITNARVIQTGLYVAANTATTDQLGGVFGGATPKTGDSLLGQTYTYNASHDPDYAQGSISVGQNSWAGGVSDSNTGLSWGNPHFSTGTGNPEANLLPTVPYVNITLGDDPLFAGAGQLAFSLYQGWATGPGLTGLNLLYTGLASAVGQNLGVTVALTGNSLNGAGAAGEYTVVVGDLSTAETNSTFDGHYRLALTASTTATAGYSVVSAVPVPGAVWLFGSALAGFIGFGPRKATVAA
jgi:hypothetical protein